MENQNVCKDCGGVKIATGTKNPETGKGKVCKECGQGVRPGAEHDHKKE